MYIVNLLLYIWDSSSLNDSKNWAVAYKNIEMPFIPFNGVEINFPLERGQKIKSIRWNVENNTFSCTLEDEFSCFGADEPLFDEWIQYYEKHGWSIEGPHPKNE